MKHIQIPKGYYKELEWEIEFDWDSYYLLQLINLYAKDTK